MRYTPLLAHIAMTTHIQNTTTIVCRSHGPVFGMPYWQMLIHIVPSLRGRSASAFCYTQGRTEHIRDDLAFLLVEIYIHQQMSIVFSSFLKKKCIMNKTVLLMTKTHRGRNKERLNLVGE